MASHSLGRIALLHKSVLPITMIFFMMTFLRKVINKTCSVLEMIQLLVKNVFGLLGQILYELAFFHITHKKEERKEHHFDVTENM